MKELDFKDTKTAFADKSDAELREKYRMFKMMNSAILNEIGTSVTKFALAMGLPVESIIKSTIFQQFCGGENIEECGPTIERLGKSNIGAILDYSIEGKSDEKELNEIKDETVQSIIRAKNDDDIPFAVFKVTSIAPFKILQKVSSNEELSESEKTKWENAQKRVKEICEQAHKINQPVFVDAEETWIQDAIDFLATGMMKKYNQNKPIVFNTIQLYRHDRLEYLKQCHKKAKTDEYILAVKLVRGAYMEKERERAKKLGYESPIQSNKAAADKDYDLAVNYCLENTDDIAFVAATHNEESVKLLTNLINETGIEPNHPNIFFSQLYGMSDNLSFVLADNSFNVSKYVPYGPIADVIPYLIRRAKENTSVSGQVSRELDLISKEIERRSNN